MKRGKRAIVSGTLMQVRWDHYILWPAMQRVEAERRCFCFSLHILTSTTQSLISYFGGWQTSVLGLALIPPLAPGRELDGHVVAVKQKSHR
jgi:hypothetical protein